MPSIRAIVKFLLCCYLLYYLYLLVAYFYAFSLIYRNVSRQQASQNGKEEIRVLVAAIRDNPSPKTVKGLSAREKELLLSDYEFLDQSFGGHGLHLRKLLVPLAEYYCKQCKEQHNERMGYLRKMRIFNLVRLIENLVRSILRCFNAPDRKITGRCGIDEEAIRNQIDNEKKRLTAYVEARRSELKRGVGSRDH